jgi:3',5'-cyclic AMP phosphodiesterase CpdA
MKLIAHISDLHFGREDPHVVAGLLADLEQAKPQLVVVSGDLTQRARRAEFARARTFLDALPAPWLAVPGNHDIPLWDVIHRLRSPLGRFRRLITNDLTPFHLDDELAVIGLNTARSHSWKRGRLSSDQLEGARKLLQPLPASVLKIAVVHHNFVPRPDGGGHQVMKEGQRALDIFDDAGVDLVLSGHLHRGYSADTRVHWPGSRRSLIVVQCGTSVSRRGRGEPNAYNLLTLTRDRVEIAHRWWGGDQFVESSRHSWQRDSSGWRRDGETATQLQP